jgi:uncharacterized membrane protein
MKPVTEDLLVDDLLIFTIGPVLGGTLCPGLTLCVPGLVLLLAPIVALAVVGLLLAAVAAVPYLAVRTAVRGLGRARLARTGLQA